MNLAAYQIIDSHCHLSVDHPQAQELLADLNVRLLNISVAGDSQGKWRRLTKDGEHPYEALRRNHPSRCSWCTSFDLPRFDDSEYAEKCIAGLEKDFRNGAVACKIWKNLGMAVKDTDGKFVMVDHAILKPIFDYLERSERTLIMHTGEPRAAWRPFGEGSPHERYYKKNTWWHFYKKDGVPSYEEILSARDRLVERHPKLRVIGAHLGSMEYDVREIAKRLDRYSNFAVDTAARVKDLACQDTHTVTDFFNKYSDRILFGTDRAIRPFSKMQDIDRVDALAKLRIWYQKQFSYYSDPGTQIGLEHMLEDQKFEGLNLSQGNLEKLFSTNALHWFPGIKAGGSQD